MYLELWKGFWTVFMKGVGQLTAVAPAVFSIYGKADVCLIVLKSGLLKGLDSCLSGRAELLSSWHYHAVLYVALQDSIWKLKGSKIDHVHMEKLRCCIPRRVDSCVPVSTEQLCTWKGWTAVYLEDLDSRVPGRAGWLCTWKGWTVEYLEGLDSCASGRAWQQIICKGWTVYLEGLESCVSGRAG
jgi:hypothetical protein